MKKDAVKKEIDTIRDVRNHIWNATIVTIGGTVAILFNLDSMLKIIFFIIGLIIIPFLVNGYFQKENKINLLIKELKEGKQK